MIIVDDEDLLRESLTKVVDWASLGFSVAGVFADGKDAIEFINNENNVKPSIILTDIKMSFVSGIQLAEYVHNRHPDIMIIIISGYRDFEYAKSAIQNNVFRYLTKPTTHEELTTVFTEAYNYLEERKKNETKDDDLQPFMRKELFGDILFGAFTDKQSLDNAVAVCNLNPNITVSRCCYIRVKITGFEQYLKEQWKYGKDRLYQALPVFFQNDFQDITLYVANIYLDNIEMIAICNGLPDNEIESRITSYLDTASKNISDILNLNTTFSISKVQDNLLLLADEYMKENKTASLLHEQKIKAICSFVSAGNSDAALNVLTSVYQTLDGDLYAVSYYTACLFEGINELMEDSDFEKLNPFSINNFTSVGEIIKYVSPVLVSASRRFTDEDSLYYFDRLIEKAMDYIKAHCADDISLDDVARHVAMSPFYFSKQFKKKTGEKFIDYLCRMRIDKAVELLSGSKYKVSEICQMVGYRNLPHFYKQFKLYTGHTPSEYRSGVIKRGQNHV